MANDALPSFFEKLGASIASTLQQLVGMAPQTTVTPVENRTGSTVADLWATASLGDDKESRLAFGVDRRAGLVLARAMLSEKPDETASFSNDDEELLAEFFKQAYGRASDDLRDQLGQHPFNYTGAQPPQWQPAMASELKLQWDGRAISLLLQLSEQLVGRLTAGESELSSPEPKLIRPPAPANSTNNLDLLLDVPLAVTLRFGARQMPLREILELASGSVIELDRQAEDAVDLLLDERLIARGQVVVIDGCYGLRVTEVCHG
jgi:flagellar motor switch protein FliN/FliY